MENDTETINQVFFTAEVSFAAVWNIKDRGFIFVTQIALTN